MNKFQQRKKNTLSKEDKSFIGKWDEKIAPLCKKINSFENYYTTSSCSGRILLMIDAEKKGKDLFIFVSHKKISFKQLKEELENLVCSKAAHNIGSESAFGQDSSLGKKVKVITNLKIKKTIGGGEKEVITTASLSEPNLKIKFKLEPCILHIACETLEDAEKIYEMGKNAGWKKSGIISLKNNFIVELNGTEKLEFPIIQKNKILVDDEFLNIVADEANKKLEKSWMRIKKLKEEIETEDETTH